MMFIAMKRCAVFACSVFIGPSVALAHPEGAAPASAYAAPAIDLRHQANDQFCWVTSGSSLATCGPCAVVFGADGIPARYTCMPDPSRLRAAPTLTSVQGTVTLMLGTTRYERDWAGNLIAVPYEVARKVPATVYVVVPPPPPPVYVEAPSYSTPAIYNNSPFQLCQPNNVDWPVYSVRRHAESEYPTSPLNCYTVSGRPTPIPARFTTTHPYGQ